MGAKVGPTGALVDRWNQVCSVNSLLSSALLMPPHHSNSSILVEWKSFSLRGQADWIVEPDQYPPSIFRLSKCPAVRLKLKRRKSARTRAKREGTTVLARGHTGARRLIVITGCSSWASKRRRLGLHHLARRSDT